MSSKLILTLVLGTVIALSAVSATVQPAEALQKAQGEYNKETRDRRICGDRLCSATTGSESERESALTSYYEQITGKTKEQKTMEQKEMKTAWTSKSGVIKSSTDPGKGHGSHQLAVILPPSDKIYTGKVTYAGAEPLQLVALHGPISDEQAKGQATWSPKGSDKQFGLTFVDHDATSGTWNFAGNALALHTMKTKPFHATYSVSYKAVSPSELTKTGTVTSEQDPGLGHESHQLAIILPPSDKTYSGTLTWSASEPVQLVALHGPVKGSTGAAPTWTPDGETKFGLTFVEGAGSSGSWEFTGNAVALHTKKTEPFTASYTVAAHTLE